jgi:hypothetical protein
MKQLKADLEKVIDDAVERGLSIEEVREVARRRLVGFVTQEQREMLDNWFRFASNMFCLIVPATIYGLKWHAAGVGRPIPNDDLLNWTCLICYLAVMANSVATLIPILQILLKFLKEKTP